MEKTKQDAELERFSKAEDAAMVERRLRIANLATAMALNSIGIDLLRQQSLAEVVPIRKNGGA